MSGTSTPGSPGAAPAGDGLFSGQVRGRGGRVSPPWQGAAGTGGGPARLTTYNARLSVALMVIVALVPVPLGSNRPVFWMLLAAVVFAVLGAYLGALRYHRLGLRVTLRRMPVTAGLGLVFLAYCMFQTLPLGMAPPFPPAAASGADAITLSRDATWMAVLRWATYAVFFFLMLQVAENRARARRMAWALFLIIAAHAAYGMIGLRFLGEEFFWGPKDAYGNVVTGTFVNRNSFATFAGFGAILGFSLLLHTQLRWRERARSWLEAVSVASIQTLILWACLLVIVGALLSSGSRMGVAASMAGMFVSGVLVIRKDVRQTGLKRVALTGGVIIVLVGVFAVFGQVVLNRAVFSEPDAGTRIELYRQVIGLIRIRPLFGFGFDAFPLAFEQIHHPPVSPDVVWGRAHSTYLTLWSETGLIFGSVPVLICTVIALRLARIVRGRDSDFVLAVAGLGALCLAAVHSLVDFSLEMPANVYVLLTILALGLAARKQQHGETR